MKKSSGNSSYVLLPLKNAFVTNGFLELKVGHRDLKYGQKVLQKDVRSIKDILNK